MEILKIKNFQIISHVIITKAYKHALYRKQPETRWNGKNPSNEIDNMDPSMPAKKLPDNSTTRENKF